MGPIGFSQNIATELPLYTV